MAAFDGGFVLVVDTGVGFVRELDLVVRVLAAAGVLVVAFFLGGMEGNEGDLMGILILYTRMLYTRANGMSRSVAYLTMIGMVRMLCTH